MACVVCFERGGESVCQCEAVVHIQCLAALTLRGYERCVVCGACWESQAVVRAVRLTVNNASDALGPEHQKVQWRKLHLAHAYADTADYAEAKRILASVLETATGREGSLFLACQVDMARAMVKLGELGQATRTLECIRISVERVPPMPPDVEFVESVLNQVNEVLGDVYVRTGELDKAKAVLNEARSKASAIGGRAPFRLVALMRVCARYHRACGHASKVCLALRVVTGVLYVEESDP